MELNDCIGGLLHLGLYYISDQMLLHLGQLLHLGLQHTGVVNLQVCTILWITISYTWMK